jgi:enolase-phosphatase E1
LTAASGGSLKSQVILLDIEGTTTPVDFVYRTLFPYARGRLGRFLQDYRDEPGIQKDIEGLRTQHRTDTRDGNVPPEWPDDSTALDLTAATEYGRWLMDRDSKCSPLKSLQGKIWQKGYELGELRGEVYPDVPMAMARWSQSGKTICIFSSGSVLAQKLLFGSVATGDLTCYLSAHFDTTIGPKYVHESYLKIARLLAVEPSNVLFISDSTKELDAARDAGMQTALCLRTEPTKPMGSEHRVIHSFADLFSEL